MRTILHGLLAAGMATLAQAEPNQPYDSIGPLGGVDPVLPVLHLESQADAYRPGLGAAAPPVFSGLRTFTSVQVNVDAAGNNILGDAANEPSLTIDPLFPNRVAVGWRQFDTISSNFRQAGNAWSRDSGRTWNNREVFTPGIFRSDPVLDVDSAGRFYYLSLNGNFLNSMFVSEDGGRNWDGPFTARGGDKAWFIVDRSGGISDGHQYQIWNTAGNPWGGRQFSRSTDGLGRTWEEPLNLPTPRPVFGTLAVGHEGTVYLCGQSGGSFFVVRSEDAKFAEQTPTFESVNVEMGGFFRRGSVNPGGLVAQVWLNKAPYTTEDGDDILYLLSSLDPSVGSNPMDVHFARSEDGGETWSEPVRVNDLKLGWQWFGTMSVAPNGRIDVVWYDTRNSNDPRNGNRSQLFYSFSIDEGRTWSTATECSPLFNQHVGYPNQNKLGDYIGMISDNAGASVIYAATFNGEQDLYFLRIGGYDCNANGVQDQVDIERGAPDVNNNGRPDECECFGDSNGDYFVGLDDLAQIISSHGACSGDDAYVESLDLDASGCINLDDLANFLQRYGSECP